ncbi:UNVERIFIED_CONTAM: Homeobox-leucine zipper protein HAT22 [Sesamum radiatum]|uniref:Homeobox-leucine zipper protein HAT22 n=1 Tax=Sesamum radiatum TaxID=300843 RepID=A0AAW2VR15_SESRA
MMMDPTVGRNLGSLKRSLLFWRRASSTTALSILTKLKQTEVDCEFLKKCCETLTDENRRLQKELQELKALKLAQAPLYMQLPAATLTMCPSCERIGADNSAKSPFTMAPKPHFYSPFTNPSAAC